MYAWMIQRVDDMPHAFHVLTPCLFSRIIKITNHNGKSRSLANKIISTVLFVTLHLRNQILDDYLESLPQRHGLLHKLSSRNLDRRFYPENIACT